MTISRLKHGQACQRSACRIREHNQEGRHSWCKLISFHHRYKLIACTTVLIVVFQAGGTIGSHITIALLSTNNVTLTAITRKGSSNSLPTGIHVAEVDYTKESTLIAALQDQQVLIITLSPTAPRETHSMLVHAAAKAGVKYIIPNGWGADVSNDTSPLGPVAKAQRDEIEALGMSWINVSCGFWYDYSLAGGEARFGFDFDKRSVTFYDEGETKISTSTLAQVARTVARVLSLKVLPEDEADESLTLSKFLHHAVCIKSFVVSQRNMFESVMRITGTADKDWTITHQDSQERYEEGLAMVKKGNMAGFSKLLYSRSFFPNDPSDLSGRAQNKLLGLPEEDLDEATRRGVEMVKQLQSRHERMAA